MAEAGTASLASSRRSPREPPADPFRLDGKVALVTGAGRGIGAAIATLFAARGASVTVANRTASTAAEVAERIGAAGGAAQSIAADLADPAAMAALVAATVARWGALDIAVHNAAVCPWRRIDDLDEATLEETFAVNLKSCFRLARAAAPYMRRRDGGRLLFTSSVTGPRVAMVGAVHYASSKAGVNGFIRAAALEYAADRITVNGVEPGFIAKPGRGRFGTRDMQQRIGQRIPLGAMGQPNDVAAAMLYLASPAAAYVTGQTVVVDGGATLSETELSENPER